MVRETIDRFAENAATARWVRAIFPVVGAFCLCQAYQPLAAAEKSASQRDAEQAEQVHEQFIIDLGNLHVKEVRPVRNETIIVTFTAHVVLAPELTKADFEVLQKYKHRLRDQVIVAVRTAETKDFREPSLARLRRLIQIRIDQVLRSHMTQNLLLSDYQFTLD